MERHHPAPRTEWPRPIFIPFAFNSSFDGLLSLTLISQSCIARDLGRFDVRAKDVRVGTMRRAPVRPPVPPCSTISPEAGHNPQQALRIRLSELTASGNARLVSLTLSPSPILIHFFLF